MECVAVLSMVISCLEVWRFGGRDVLISVEGTW